MIQINLLPDIKVVHLKIRRLRIIVFLVALFTITLCTIFLLIIGSITLVQQKNELYLHEEHINAYVREFNGPNGEKTQDYLSFQKKFETLEVLEEEKIDANRVWSNGLFGEGSKSFLPEEYLNKLESFSFNFDNGEFRVTGSVEGIGKDVNIRDYFKFAYYEIGERNEEGKLRWSCPLAPEGGNSPGWTYCPMFKDVKLSSEFNPDLEAERRVTISAIMAVEVPGVGSLFDDDIEMRVRVARGCSDITCIHQPDIGENEPQDFNN